MSVNTYFKALLGRYRDARCRNWEQPSAPHNEDVETVKEDIKQYLKESQIEVDSIMNQNRIQKKQNKNIGILIDDNLDRLDTIRRDEGPGLLSAIPRYEDLNYLLYKEYILFFILLVLGVITIYQFKTIRSEFQKLAYKRNYIYKV